jgi:hypothetical protein
MQGCFDFGALLFSNLCTFQHATFMLELQSDVTCVQPNFPGVQPDIASLQVHLVRLLALAAEAAANVPL